MEFGINKAEKFGSEGVKGLSIRPGRNVSVAYVEVEDTELPARQNRVNDRTYFIVEGAATFEVNGQDHKVLPGESISIPKETVYKLKPAGKLKLIKVDEPPFSIDDEFVDY